MATFIRWMAEHLTIKTTIIITAIALQSKYTINVLPLLREFLYYL
ncbi:uncharacterized protein Thert_01562 [Thermoanaerobacterium thermosaccharolyticum]|uniref:Uncharacterized protein n=1 Tax=Thermoanaerobacterium thermosaccharolyticum TaxID=1517 RepID=A0A223HZ63_THETR|nr:uncharacterized protein Thert_01562 [Thermoanaerobacterium thermosaccharolyticum]